MQITKAQFAVVITAAVAVVAATSFGGAGGYVEAAQVSIASSARAMIALDARACAAGSRSTCVFGH